MLGIRNFDQSYLFNEYKFQALRLEVFYFLVNSEGKQVKNAKKIRDRYLNDLRSEFKTYLTDNDSKGMMERIQELNSESNKSKLLLTKMMYRTKKYHQLADKYDTFICEKAVNNLHAKGLLYILKDNMIGLAHSGTYRNSKLLINSLLSFDENNRELSRAKLSNAMRDSQRSVAKADDGLFHRLRDNRYSDINNSNSDYSRAVKLVKDTGYGYFRNAGFNEDQIKFFKMSVAFHDTMMKNDTDFQTKMASSLFFIDTMRSVKKTEDLLGLIGDKDTMEIFRTTCNKFKQRRKDIIESDMHRQKRAKMREEVSLANQNRQENLKEQATRIRVKRRRGMRLEPDHANGLRPQ